MKKFLYTSANPCHTSLTIKGETINVSFYEGEVYELPANNPFVKQLEAQGYLKNITKPSKQK